MTQNLKTEGLAGSRVAMIANMDFKKDFLGGVQNYTSDLTESLCEMGVQVWKFGLCTDGREPGRNERFLARTRISNYILLPVLARAAFGLRDGSNWIVHVHRPEQIVPLTIAGRRNIAYVCSMHGPAKRGVQRNRGAVIGWVYSALELIGLLISDAVIFVDRRTHDEYTGKYGWLRGKASIIGGGVASSFYEGGAPGAEIIDRIRLQENEKLFCYVGRLDKEKNVGLIVSAFKLAMGTHGDIKLGIAGDGPMRSSIERQILESNLAGRVILLGSLPRIEVRALLTASDALILASEWEGSPLVVKEALAAGARVIAPNVGDIPELIVDRSCGIIIGERTEEALADGIINIARGGGGRVPSSRSDEFRWDKIAERVLFIYSSIVRERFAKKKRGAP